MNIVLSILFSIITALIPIFTSIPRNKKAEQIETVIISENGSDVFAIDENGSIVDESFFDSETENAISAVLPESYDSRDDELVTEVKSQGNTGCCWAFAAISAAETNMIKKDLPI